MTPIDRIDRFERELPDALRDVAGTVAPDYLSDTLGRTARTRQRPAWASLERWLPMDIATPRAATARVPWKTISVLALVALLLGALLVAYTGSQRRVPAPFGPARNGLIPYALGGDIYLGDPVTGASQLVIGGPEDDAWPAFSPDGTKLLFVRAVPGGELVLVADADGGNARVLTPTPIQGFVTSSWTPASDGIVVGHDVNSRQRLEILPVDGGPPRLLLEDAAVDWVVYRPPAGEELLVRGRIDGTWGLYSMRPDGSGIRLLAPSELVLESGGVPDQDLNFPAYSPDGSLIYYNRYTPEAETIQAWVMNADGTGQRPFQQLGPSRGWWEGEMAPSPDGRWIAMWRTPPSGRGEITLYPSDGSGGGVVIGPDAAGTATWSWAPDSSRLLMTHNDAAEGGQVLIDPSTGDWTEPAWRTNTLPDWQRLAQ